MPGVITSTSNYLLVDFQPESNVHEESFQAIYVAIGDL